MLTKNKKAILVSLSALVIAVVAGGGIASANFGSGWLGMKNQTPDEIAAGFNKMVEEKANLLGITSQEFKSLWAEGKNFWEIAESKGITKDQLQDKMQAKRQALLKERLQMLVERGVIVQEQADKRLQTQSELPGRGVGLKNGLMRHWQGAQPMQCPMATPQAQTQ